MNSDCILDIVPYGLSRSKWLHDGTFKVRYRNSLSVNNNRAVSETQ